VFTAHDNRITMGGQFFPNGQGEAVDGGYRLSGSWSFGSGTGHSEYIAAEFMPMDNGQVRWISEGLPDMQVAIVPRDDITFTDGWYVQGLKGTGSYDYNAVDVLVPAYRTFALFAREPHRGTSPATRMGLMPVTAAGHASWALGVAKSMLDDVRRSRRVWHTTSQRGGPCAEWAHLVAGTSSIREGSRLERAFRIIEDQPGL
jgi:indole-3-acetate monooxygenase